MSDLHPIIVGRIMAKFAEEDLAKGAGQDGVFPMLRIKGLAREEIEHTARLLVQLREESGQPCALKIAERSPWPGCPEEWFLSDGETRAKYRNSCRSTLVLIDHEPEPDEQSLRNMHSISDSAILVGAGDAGEDRRQLVIDLVWSALVKGADEMAPGTLHKTSEFVFDTYQNVNREVSLRTWVGFLIATVELLASAGKIADEAEVRLAVALSLPALTMFPDRELFDRKQAAVKRRLVKNIHFGSFRSDTGKELSEEEFEKRIDEAAFRDEKEVQLPPAESEAWQNVCRDLVLRDRGERNQIPYRIWAQLFDKESRKRGLGELIRDRIEREHPSRLDELNDLDVGDGLDQRDVSAAEALLKKEPDDPESQPLIDLLTKPQRRAVEKLALPSSPYTDDPMTTLLKALYGELGQDALDEEEVQPSEVVLAHEELAAGPAYLSLAVFRFLYGGVLRELAEFENPGRSLRFSVAKQLLEGSCDFVSEYCRLFPPQDDDEDGQERDVLAQWAPLRFVLKRDGEPVQRFSWRPDQDPGRVAFARMVCEQDPWVRFEDTHVQTDSWFERAFDPEKTLSPDRVTPSELPAFVEEWIAARSANFEAWARDGVTVDGLREHVDAWEQVVERVRTEHIPRGSRVPVLDFFLDTDTALLGGGRTVLVATHPLRLRWLARFLDEARRSLQSILEGTFTINSGAEDFYFEKRSALSPHRQPPILCSGHGELSIAVREIGWSEEFAKIETSDGASSDWMSALDESSVDEMAQVVESYLQAHPHKKDGLAILFVSGDGEASHVERLVRRVLRANVTEPPSIRVYVIAPPLAHDEIARVLEQLDDSQKTSDRLLPRLQTFVLSDELIRDPSGSGLEGRIDLALVPNIFGKKTTVLPQSRRAPRLNGAFNVLLHPTSYDLEAGDEQSGENVSRALLPESEDILLESWSTLAVRRKTESTVTQGGDELTDLFALRVRFTESLDLFRRLHDWAHWVVTLDPFVGREQIEAIEDRPDVITVKPHVGKNGNYTLVVSSSAGREFVVTRLARKLETDLAVAEGPGAWALAEKIYENGRSFAPGVVLRALGLGRTSHELVGLLVSRWAVVERFPVPADCEYEFEAWLSLDEHARWFGGLNAQRADMLRILAVRVDNRLQLMLQVVEAKFRKEEYVGTADNQVRRTMDLLPFVFAGASGHGETALSADAAHWRNELIDALQQSASRARDGSVFTGLHTREDGDGGASYGLPARVRQEILEGDYDLVDARGIVCSVAHGTELPDVGVTKRDSGYDWIRVGRGGMTRILDAFGRGGAPTPYQDTPAWHGTAEPQDRSTIDDDAVVEVGEPGRGPAETATTTAEQKRTSRDEEVSPQIVQTGAGRGGLGESELERRYQRVLDVFSEFEVTVKKPQDGLLFAEGPAFYQVRIVPGSGVRADAVMSQVSELKLKLGLPAELMIRAFVDRGAVTFQIPKATEERYFVTAQDLWKSAPPAPQTLSVPIGEDVDGDAISIEFSSAESPHLLIGGTTGSGKSVVMEAILAGLCEFYDPSLLRLKMVDPKGTELVDFEDDPHVDGEIGAFAEDAIELLDREVAEMQRRYAKLKEKRCRTLVEFNDRVEPEERMPWHLIVLDEYADLTADKNDRTKIETSLKRIAQKARAAGIHLIVATQKPSAEILSTSIRSNLPAQLCLRVKTGTDSRMIMDETGGETLAGKGDAFFKTAKRLVRVQCAMVER